MASAEQAWARTEGSLDSGYQHSGSDYDGSKSATTDRFDGKSSSELVNVGSGERWVSLAAGSILSLLGLERRDRIGLLIASLGGALLYRGVTGRCYLYQALNLSTVEEHPHGVTAMASSRSRLCLPGQDGIHITQSFLINQPAEKLYDYWRRLENLPNFMTQAAVGLNRRHRAGHLYRRCRHGSSWIPGAGIVLRQGEDELDDRNGTSSRAVHRYVPELLDHVRQGRIDPSFVVTHRLPLTEAPDAYNMFREKKDGCIKVVLDPMA